MRATYPRTCTALLCAAALQSAAAADAPPDDLDALSLADKPAAKAPEAAAPWRGFVEGAAAETTQRRDGGHAGARRASLDLRFDARLSERWRTVLSDRLDLFSGNGPRDTNTLREAYLSWARADDQAIDIGRVNVRHGVAWGFNPTDWFKENALRSIVSPDPAVLRENRLGSFVLQGQQLWQRAALTATFSPKLGDAPNPATWALDAGATNPRDRWLLAASAKLGEGLNPELLAYGGAGRPTQLGFNVSGLVGGGTVLFAEASTGRGRSLVEQALGSTGSERTRQRAALGATYTTAFNLGVTVEAEYNGAGPTEAQWRALPALDPQAPLRVLGAAQALQDLPTRRAWFVYLSWKDVAVRRLDLSAFVRRDAEGASRAHWFETRYRFERADLSLQWQWFSGAPGSLYASVPQRRVIELVLRAYL